MPYVLKCHTENKPILKIENNAKESDSDGTEIAMIVVKGLMGATMFIFFCRHCIQNEKAAYVYKPLKSGFCFPECTKGINCPTICSSNVVGN